MSSPDAYYDVLIRRNADGVERVYRQYEAWDADWEWEWTDGRFACDCCRSECFRRVVGHPPEPREPCGDTRYTVPYVTLPDGTKVKIDDE